MAMFFGLDAPTATEAQKLTIRKLMFRAIIFFVLAVSIWIYDKTSLNYYVFGHAIWHILAAFGVGHLVTSAAYTQMVCPQDDAGVPESGEHNEEESKEANVQEELAEPGEPSETT